MKRLLTGVTMAALLAAGQASATASAYSPADRAMASQASGENQMMGAFGGGWLVVSLGLVLLVVVIVENNNRSDHPTSP